MKTITYSKNVFIPLTTACSNNCTYCRFQTPLTEAEINSLSKIQSTLQQAKQAGCKEVLFTCGSQPEKIAGFKTKLQDETNFTSFFSLLTAACRQALNLGLLPHTNPGVISASQLNKLARYNASLGLMLETTAKVKAHAESPTKQPAVRQELIAEAGRLKIPFTSGLLVGIGESRRDRITSLKQLADLHLTYGHLQEIILQPVDPPLENQLKPPSTALLLDTLQLAQKILPSEIALQVPPNLVDLQQIIGSPVNDLGGISPLTIDYINPDHNWPEIKQLKTKFPKVRFMERLPVYSQYLTNSWLAEPVINCLQSEGWLDEYKATTNTN